MVPREVFEMQRQHNEDEMLCRLTVSYFIERNRRMIDKPYAYHKPSEAGHAKITQLREAFSNLDRVIQQCCPDGRQKAVAITNVEQAAMWAIKAVVFNDPASTVEQPPEPSAASGS